MTTRSCHQVLGLPANPTLGQVKKAFREKVLRLHPDKRQQDTEEEAKEAKDEFLAVHEAYRELVKCVRRDDSPPEWHEGTASEWHEGTASDVKYNAQRSRWEPRRQGTTAGCGWQGQSGNRASTPPGPQGNIPPTGDAASKKAGATGGPCAPAAPAGGSKSSGASADANFKTRRKEGHQSSANYFPDVDLNTIFSDLSSSDSDNSDANEYAEGLGCAKQRWNKGCDDGFNYEFSDHPREEYFEQPRPFKYRRKDCNKKTYEPEDGYSSRVNDVSIHKLFAELERREAAEQNWHARSASRNSYNTRDVLQRPRFEPAARGCWGRSAEPSHLGQTSFRQDAARSTSTAKLSTGHRTSQSSSHHPSSQKGSQDACKSEVPAARFGQDGVRSTSTAKLSTGHRTSQSSSHHPSTQKGSQDACKCEVPATRQFAMQRKLQRDEVQQVRDTVKRVQEHALALGMLRQRFEAGLFFDSDIAQALSLFEALKNTDIDHAVLRETKIGKELNQQAWRSHRSKPVAEESRGLVQKWRTAYLIEREAVNSKSGGATTHKK